MAYVTSNAPRTGARNTDTGVYMSAFAVIAVFVFVGAILLGAF